MQSKSYMMIAFILVCCSFLIAPVWAQSPTAILGTVIKYDRDPLSGNFRDQGPVSGAEISLEGQQGTLTTMTDDKGAYRFSDLAAGTYSLKCKPPAQFVLLGPAQQVIELRSGVNAMLDFVVRTNGKISGRVLSETGVPVMGIVLDLLPIEQKDSDYPRAVSTASHAEGEYRFDGIPPGRFLLGIRLDSELAIPYPRVYYDGAIESRDATVLELQEGQQIENIDLRLPSPLQTRIISGLVKSNNRPASDAWVSFQINEYPNSRSAYAVCNTQGRFLFQAFAGLRYSVSANNSFGHADSVEITAWGDADIRLDIIPTKGPLNLLLNSDATENATHWIPSRDAIIESAAGHNRCFSLRNQGSFHQEVILPPEAEGKYAVLLGLASSERINPDGSITGLPCLYGFMLNDASQIIAHLQGQRMLGSEKVPNKWGPLYGIFMVPPGTTRMRYFLNQAERIGVPQNGSAARFDDLGLYLLPTKPEAMRFVQDHFGLENEQPMIVGAY